MQYQEKVKDMIDLTAVVKNLKRLSRRLFLVLNVWH